MARIDISSESDSSEGHLRVTQVARSLKSLRLRGVAKVAVFGYALATIMLHPRQLPELGAGLRGCCRRWRSVAPRSGKKVWYADRAHRHDGAPIPLAPCIDPTPPHGPYDPYGDLDP
jgi:hypothetical protein